ncbi:MAG: hypothetical protein WD649_05405 [Thermoleophilaceae bacterium]
MRASLPSRSTASERGTGFVELLAVVALLLLMSAAALAIVSAGGREEKQPGRAQSLAESKGAFDEMRWQLGQAHAINSISYVRIDFNARLRGRGSRRIAYDCGVPAQAAGLGSCVRYEGPAGRPLPAQGVVVIDWLLNGRADAGGRVFFPDDSSRPRSVRARVDLVGEGTALEGYRERVILEHEVELARQSGH